MALEKGILRISKSGSIQIEVPTKKGGTANLLPSRGEISQSVLDRLNELAGKEVEFERVGGQPKKVREVGGSFIPPQRGVQEERRKKRLPGGTSQPRWPQERQEPTRREVCRDRRDFHNPYNFVPAPPRNTKDEDLGDHCPVELDAFHLDRYSGTIRVRMTAKTPLLVPDTERATEEPNGHKTFPLRVDGEGKPLIPASSVRGMLRCAYEAITNSRFGRFSCEQHGDRLGFRMDPSEGLRLIPARIDNGRIHLLTGTSGIQADGRPDGPMYAAWLPRYDREGQVANWAVRYADGSLPAHGDEVVCWVEKMQHFSPKFTFWLVREIVRGNDLNSLGSQPSASQPRGKAVPAEPREMRRVHGWVCVTNANINRKHDERVFFYDGTGKPEPFGVTGKHQQLWRELIENYQRIHAEDLRKRRARNQKPDEYLGSEPGQTAWSRHVYSEADRELSDGTLCYVRLTADGKDVEALFPVMIARELYPVSPWKLLHDSLKPAGSIHELSPADRVFGWVKVDADTGSESKGERVAARGLLRVGTIHCESSTSDAVELFPAPGLPLAILSAPKPQQGRFYVAKSQNGDAQADGLSKREAGYAPDKGLRGRKVYPHHKSLPDGYWENPMADRTQQRHGPHGHYQEYRRPCKNGEEQRDDQNRSILGWVKPGAQFSFDLYVQNLSKVELGALLWLLELPKDCFLRFGGGKPLGFGSVRLEVVSLDVRQGEELRARYNAWYDTTTPGDPREDAKKAFTEAVVRAYAPEDGVFENVSFIRAFLTACRGYGDDLPIHYPRATAGGRPGPPSPDGESFKWFVANERREARYVLQDLASDNGLPTLPERPGGGGKGHGRQDQRRGPGRALIRSGERIRL